MANENWKIGLLLLVPLFYRTVRAFLERVEEFMGMKAPRTPILPSTTAVQQNPKVESGRDEERGEP
jgi:hypothetical protein